MSQKIVLKEYGVSLVLTRVALKNKEKPWDPDNETISIQKAGKSSIK